MDARTKQLGYVFGGLVAGLTLVLCLSEPVFGDEREGIAEVSATPCSRSFELRPGVVIDPSTPAIYLMGTGKGLRAVDPRTGKTIWKSETEAKPLLVSDTHLLAQAEEQSTATGLSLLVLDTNQGNILRSILIPLPPGVRPSIDEGLGASFLVTAHAESERVVVVWKYSERHVSAAPPPGSKPIRAMLEGAVSINLEKGDTTLINLDQWRADPPLLPTILPLVDSGKIKGRLHAAGEIYASASLENSDSDGLQLVLRRWRALNGKPLPRIVLVPKRPVAYLTSADKLHLLAVDAVSRRDPAWQDYRWSIFSLATGELISETTRGFSAQPFCLLADRILWTSPPYGRRIAGEWIAHSLELHGNSLKTSVQGWSITLHDPEYRGTLPPVN